MQYCTCYEVRVRNLARFMRRNVAKEGLLFGKVKLEVVGGVMGGLWFKLLVNKHGLENDVLCGEFGTVEGSFLY